VGPKDCYGRNISEPPATRLCRCIGADKRGKRRPARFQKSPADKDGASEGGKAKPQISAPPDYVAYRDSPSISKRGASIRPAPRLTHRAVSAFRGWSRDGRYTSNSGHSVAALYRSRWARSDQSAAQQDAAYSMTSSAATSMVGGNLRPSALAVFRLSTNLNLVGCSIGMSPGFSPLRILSTK
jgi:hypothetical protein